MKDTVSKIFPEESEIVSPPLFDVGEPVKPLFEDFVEPEPEKPEFPDLTRPMEFLPPLAGAIISPCGLFRYTLWRRFKEQRDGEKHLLWGMANPSTADHTQNDATIDQVEFFSRREGAAIATVVNFAAFRTKNPKEMRAAADPFGPDNFQHILRCVENATVIVVAWGNIGEFKDAGRNLFYAIKSATMRRKPILCFGVTKKSQPRHPLYVSHKTALRPFDYEEGPITEEPL